MTKEEFINELFMIYNKQLTESDINSYRLSMKNVNPEYLTEIMRQIKYGDYKFIPKPVELERMSYSIYQDKNRTQSLQFIDKPIEDVCVFCDDVGLIPFVTRYSFPNGQFRAGYGLACKCSYGMNFIRKYGDYFEVFPDFEFSDA